MHDSRKLVRALEEITDRIVGGADLDAVLGRIVSALTDVLHAARCSILLRTAPELLRMRAAVGIPPEILGRTVIRLGEGIAGEVARCGEARLLRNLRSRPGREVPYATGSAICAPLRLRGEILGVVNLNDKRPPGVRGYADFDDDDLLLAVLLANQGAMAIDAARSLESARERERLRQSLAHLEAQVGALESESSALEVVRQVTDLMVSSEALDDVLARIVDGTTTLLGAERGSLMLVEPGSGAMRICAAVGVPDDVVARAETVVGRGIAGRVAETGEAELIHAPASPGSAADRSGQYRSRSAICVPLRLREEVLGVLNINDRADDQPFDERDLFVAQLIANQAAVALTNARLLADGVRAAETRRSLEVARQIQQSFVPEEPRVPGFRVTGLSVSADETGGDYIDYGPREDAAGRPTGQLFVAVGDVSGHGVGAALLMATSRAFLRALLSQSADLAEVFERLNRLVMADLRQGQFMTLFGGIADAEAGRLVYTSAGHDPPILVRRRDGSLLELAATGPPLGIVADVRFPTASVAFEAGDVVALATDGVWEATSPEGEVFGRERLGQAVRALAGRDPAELVESVLAQVHGFTGGASLRDDRSLVALRRDPL